MVRTTSTIQTLVLLGLVMVGAMQGGAPAAATEAAWARVATGGYTILLRHGRTTGAGDPPGFHLDDCATQNNLSDRGRQQASRIGVRFAARAAPINRVYSSQWCRALETAELAFGSQDIEELPALNSIAAEGADEAAQTAETAALINSFGGPGNQVLITHPENIVALTGSEPREGEAIILAPAEDEGETPEIVGRILLD